VIGIGPELARRVVSASIIPCEREEVGFVHAKPGIRRPPQRSQV
jgi:hypothetical protein